MLRLSIRETFHFCRGSERRNAADFATMRNPPAAAGIYIHTPSKLAAAWNESYLLEHRRRASEISDQAIGSIRRITTPNASEPASAINAAITNAQ